MSTPAQCAEAWPWPLARSMWRDAVTTDEILRVLTRCLGRAVTKQHLYDHAWRYDWPRRRTNGQAMGECAPRTTSTTPPCRHYACPSCGHRAADPAGHAVCQSGDFVNGLNLNWRIAA